MAQNYNLGAKFGLNVSLGKKQEFTFENERTVVKNSSAHENESFFAKYEDVFNGNVEHDINMYSRQAMFVGMSLKASDGNIRRFDMNI